MWKLNIIIALFSASLLILFVKKLTASVKSDVIMLYVFIFTSIIFIVTTFAKGHSIRISLNTLLLIVATSVFSYMANYFWTESIRTAPNAGYVTALFELKIIPIVLLSVIIFKDSLTLQKVIGMILCLTGGVIVGYK